MLAFYEGLVQTILRGNSFIFEEGRGEGALAST
jgi:hypothetical protein